MRTNYKTTKTQDQQEPLPKEFLSAINDFSSKGIAHNIHFLHRKKVAEALGITENDAEQLFLLQYVIYHIHLEKEKEARAAEDVIAKLVNFALGRILESYNPKQRRLKNRNCAIYRLKMQGGYTSLKLAKIFRTSKRQIDRVIEDIEKHIAIKTGLTPQGKTAVYPGSFLDQYKAAFIDVKKGRDRQIKSESDFLDLLDLEQFDKPLKNISSTFPAVSNTITILRELYPSYLHDL